VSRGPAVAFTGRFAAIVVRGRGAALLLGILLLGAHCGGDEGPSEMSAATPPTRVLQPPGSPPQPAELARSLLEAVEAKGADYRPRTRHFNADGTARYVNRLILEPSPYLLQHAHNPVDWHPWGEEAFARARREGKPVLLSVGYATCHWCHVMEEESFEDEEIARLMNEHYVAIKVDREQRPDVDAVYMAAVQRLTGRGGWPMTVWLTADRQPFYAGTYFPPRAGVRGARTGFDQLLVGLAERFQAEPAKILDAAADLTGRLQAALAPAPSGSLPTAAPLHAAYASLRDGFDDPYGGFGGAPKFPRTVTLEFLLRYHRRTGEARARDMVVQTLDRMANGGIYDHVGGGFHRYATDRAWLVPHFEKMLYDNALITVAYLEAYQTTGREDFAAVARDILRYVRREMTAPEGGFYSATDADSEGEEGRFFVWTPAELADALGPERARIVAAYYDVTDAGNFEGASILHVPQPPTAVAATLGMSVDDLLSTVRGARDDLYRARARRVPPLTDRKIQASWNGLMISAFARAAQILDGPADEREAHVAAATGAAEFILSHMRVDGRLRHGWFQGRPTAEGFLDDYAFVGAGCLDLFEATGDPRWLDEAIELHQTLEEHHWDRQDGAYFTTASDAEPLLAREKPDYDGAEPSGNSVALLNVLRLHELTTNDHYRRLAEDGLRALGGSVAAAPVAVPKLLAALDFQLDRPKTVVVVEPEDGAGADAILRVLARTFVPNRALAIVPTGTAQRRLAAVVPLVSDKIVQGGRATAYVCENRVCAVPTSDPEVLARQLSSTLPLPQS